MDGNCYAFKIMKFYNNLYSLNRYIQFLIQISIIILGSSVGIVLVGSIIGGYYDVNIATTDNPQTADKIQKLLTTYSSPTTRYKDGTLTKISIRAKEDSDAWHIF